MSILLILLPVRYSLERVKPFHILERQPDWVIELKELNSKLDPTEPNLLFNTAYPIEAMFYCHNLIAYSHIPNENKIDSLEAVGYCIYYK